MDKKLLNEHQIMYAIRKEMAHQYRKEERAITNLVLFDDGGELKGSFEVSDDYDAKMPLTAHEFESDFKGELENLLCNISSLDELEKFENNDLFELIDRKIPIYNWSLMELASDSHAYTEVMDSGVLPKNPTIYDIIRAATDENLRDIAYEMIKERREEIENGDDSDEDEE